PFLGDREELPGITDDVPGHPGRYLVSRVTTFPENGKYLLSPVIVMMFQFFDSCPTVAKDPPVAGEDQIDVKHVGLVQTCQIGRQGIPVVEPALDIGCYVVEDVVSGNKILLAGFVKARVAEAVAGCLHADQLVVSCTEAVAFLARLKSGHAPDPILEAGVVVECLLDLTSGEPLEACKIPQIGLVEKRD